LINNSEIIEKIGRAAREEMKKRPSWNEVAKRTENVYKEKISK
jgi:glycosyltransferase involved in cell wall biosynthesis